MSCGAGTTVDELDAALAENGQRVTLPPWGTVGGVLAVGRSGVRRLGDGPVRDALLQAGVVTADGLVAKAGGPTVKNVSGFDLCRLLVGSIGTLAFIGDVILRTRPRPLASAWYRAGGGTRPVRGVPLPLPSRQRALGRVVDVGVAGGAPGRRRRAGEVHGPLAGRRPAGAAAPPTVRAAVNAPGADGDASWPRSASAWSTTPSRPPRAAPEVEVVALHRRIKERFDPAGRLNPGRDPLSG